MLRLNLRTEYTSIQNLRGFLTPILSHFIYWTSLRPLNGQQSKSVWKTYTIHYMPSVIGLRICTVLVSRGPFSVILKTSIRLRSRSLFCSIIFDFYKANVRRTFILLVTFKDEHFVDWSNLGLLGIHTFFRNMITRLRNY